MPGGGVYAWDPLTPFYLVTAVGVAGAGMGVMLFERFTPSSRRFYLLTHIMGAWIGALGIARLAAEPAAAELWLRVAFAFLPFTVPAVHWMALSMAPVPRSLMNRGLWFAAAAFVAVDLTGPWLVHGLERVTREGSLTGSGWIGASFLAFETTAIAITVRRLLRSRRGALSGAESTEKIVLAAGVLVGALCMVDYVLPTDPFRAGWVTPSATLASCLIVAGSALRFRLFAPGQSFATDEVLRTMADAVLVCDGTGRIRGSNPAAHRLLRQSEDRLLGRSVAEVIGARGSRRSDPGWTPEPGAELSDLDLELRPRSGSAIAVSVSTRPIRFGDRPVGAVVVARDVRERIRSEHALQRSDLRYRALFHHNPAIVFELGTDGAVVRLNPAGRRLLGLNGDEPLGEAYDDLVHPDDVETARSVIRDVLAGQSREYELSAVSPADGRHSVRGFAVPIHDGERVVGVLGVALDVTAETRAKRELEVQRQYFAELFESAPEAIVLVGSDGEIRRVNGEFTRLFGYGREEVLGHRLDDLIVPDERREEGVALTADALAGGLARAETTRRRNDGTHVEVSLLARAILVPGEPPQMYAIYRDSTDRNEAQRRLREREEELRHAQKLEAVGKLAGGVAHDFNNLVTVINGHARFALDEIDTDHPLHTDLQAIDRAGARAAALTQQLLAFSRRQLLRPEVLDLNDVVRELHRMLARLIGEHIRLRTSIGARDARVRVDRGQLEQVLVNLVVNARDAMPDGGTLTIESESLDLEPSDVRLHAWDMEPGRYARLVVRDTGTGMDDATLERAFEPFFTTKERGKGTGLGLSTVFGIVKQSGGHVEARSRPGAGTTVAVVLPLAEEAAPTPGPDTPTPGSDRDAVAGGTVLVVEDEDAVRTLAVRVLERRGYHVLAACDGQHALSVVERNRGAIDLVLSDVVMPRMGGHELATALAVTLPHVPVLLMSGYDEDQVTDGADLPTTAFLSKPFTPAALAARVAGAIGRGRNRGAGPRTVGPLRPGD